MTPPELGRHLDEAGRWLAAEGQSARRASLDHFRAVQRLRSFTTVYLAVSGFLLLVLALWGVVGVGVAFRYKEPKLFYLPLTIPPAVLFVAVVVCMTLRLVRVRRRLEDRRAAAVPAHGGLPECRLCGADLPSTTGEPWVHCRFCGAGNLVDRKVLARVGTAKLESLDTFRETLRREAGAAQSAAETSLVGSIVAAVALPAGVIGIAVVVLFVAIVTQGSDRAPRRPLSYVPFGNERCVANVQELADGKLEVDAGRLPDETRWSKDLPPKDVVIVREADLKGKVATLYACTPKPKKKGDKPPPRPPPRTVTIVRVDEVLGDLSLVVQDGGKETSWAPTSSCGLCYK